nr:MAG TPA: hypothetical protein [Caudoviricetes sp.]
MNCIVIDYDQAKLEGSPKAIPTGQSGFSKIKFKFSEEWAGMMKIAQFAQEKSRYNVSVENDGCYCPTELTKGWVFVRVRGYSESSTIATANEIKLPVVNGFVPGGSPSVPPEPDLYQKLIEETKSQIGNLDDLETTDKSNLVGAINEARDRVYDDAGVTPATYAYVNPLTKKDDSVTLLVREGTLTQIGDDATDAVKVAWNATMYLAAYSQTCLNMPKTQMDNWVTLYRAGLISERFEYQVTTAPIWRESVIYSASQNTLVYQRTGQETVRMYYNLTTDTLESYSAFISPLTRTQKPDGTSSVSQFALAADPTADMQVATKQYVDNAVENAGGGDISLGLSGIMEPGEVPVVKTVDDNGVPTSWGTRYIMDGATGSNSDLVSLLGLNAMMPRVTQNVQKMGINSAKVGQTLKINAVNKAGEPIAWVAVDAFALLGDYISTAISSTSTDDELASAKAVYDAITAAIGNIDTLVGTGEVTT